jgi:hypothetical protein
VALADRLDSISAGRAAATAAGSVAVPAAGSACVTVNLAGSQEGRRGGEIGGETNHEARERSGEDEVSRSEGTQGQFADPCQIQWIWRARTAASKAAAILVRVLVGARDI